MAKSQANSAQTPKVVSDKKPFINMPKLSSAQIENRKYSIYVKNLTIQSDEKISRETAQVEDEIKFAFSSFGHITHISVDGSRKTAIIRFRQVDSAKNAYLHSRDINPETQKRYQIVGYPHLDAQVVYVIPETSIEDEQKLEAAQNNTAYDPLSGKDITLDKITKLITE